MAEQKTTLVYEAKAKGFAETKRAIDETNKAASTGPQTGGAGAGQTPLGKGAVGIDALNLRLMRLSKTIGHDLLRSLDLVEKAVQRIAQATGGGPVPPPPAGGGGGSGGGGGNVPPGAAPAASARAAPSPARGSLTQGLLEGLLSGNLSRMIQRGPGAMTQAAGITAGQSLRDMGGTAAHFLTASLHGSAGVQSALSGIPVVGNMLAMQMGLSQRGVDFERQRFGDSFMLGRGFAPPEETALVAGERPYLERLARRRVGGMSRQGVHDALNAGSHRGTALTGAMDRLLALTGTALGPAHITDAQSQRERRSLEQQYLARSLRASDHRLRGAKIAAEARQHAGTLSELESIGSQTLGEDLPSMLNFATGVAGGSGMALGTMAQGLPMVRRAAELSSVYGLRPEVSGAFEGGYRNNALSPESARGAPSGIAQLDRTMRDAVASGLDGTGLTDYMEQMSQDIRSFATTGIPVAPDSVMRMAETARGTSGVGLARSIGIARGAQATGRRLGESGPTSAGDAMLFNELMGGKPLTASSYYQMRRKLANGDADVVQAQRSVLTKQYKALLGPGKWTQDKHNAAMNSIMALNQSSSMPMNVNELDQTMLASVQESDNDALGAAQKNDAYQARGTRSYDPAAAAARHARDLPSGRTEADTSNKMLQSGEKFAATATKIDNAMATVGRAITDKFAPTINDLVDESVRFKNVIGDVVNRAEAFMARVDREGVWDAMHDKASLRPAQ